MLQGPPSPHTVFWASFLPVAWRGGGQAAGLGSVPGHLGRGGGGTSWRCRRLSGHLRVARCCSVVSHAASRRTSCRKKGCAGRRMSCGRPRRTQSPPHRPRERNRARARVRDPSSRHSSAEAGFWGAGLFRFGRWGRAPPHKVLRARPPASLPVPPCWCRSALVVSESPRAGGGAVPGSAELYDVLCAGEGALGGAGVLLAVQLGQLQHRHVAERTHFSHFQPFDEAPGGGHRQRRGGYYKGAANPPPSLVLREPRQGGSHPRPPPTVGDGPWPGGRPRAWSDLLLRSLEH